MNITAEPVADRAASVQSPWFHIFWFSLLLTLCYAPVIQNITQQWSSDDDMGHGFFVPVIVGFIVWERRDVLLAARVARSSWGLLVLLCGMLLALTGALTAEIFTERVALVVSILGLILYFGGAELLRRLAFPLLLLCFALPLPGILYKQITFPLQIVATRVAESGLELLGRTVLREGNVLEMAGQQISVVEACSGIRALLSLAFFSLAYAYLVHPKVWVRWFLLAAAVPVAVVANASRVMITGLLGEYDERLAHGFFHGMSGWVVFVIAIGMLVGIERVARVAVRKWAKA